MQPSKLFNWYQALNRCHIGLISQFSHTEAWNKNAYWIMFRGKLHWKTDTGTLFVSKDGVATIRKPKQIFYEVE